MIFDQDIGDLFVIRVAGNIVAPSLVGSVEFATSTFGTSVIVVMGHTQCGAITATLKHIESSQVPSSENIHDLVSRIKPHVYPIAQMQGITFEEKVTISVAANVIASVDRLSHCSRLIEELVYKKQLRILGAVLDLSTGYVSCDVNNFVEQH
jgi:carbonic anhydrase